jgi:hypothetical protein
MAETHLTDGTAYAVSTFGATNSDGVWIPAVGPSVTYGTNGFYLKFENSGAMGTDSSGNSNTFSVGGGTVRQVPDTPTNNFCTMNPLSNAIPSTLSEGNLKSVPTAYNDKYVFSTFSLTSGKWYFEVKDIDQGFRGVVLLTDSDHNSALAGSNYIGVALFTGGLFTSSGTINSNLSVFSDNDILSVAIDLDNGQMWASKNGNIDTSTTANVTGFATSGYDRDLRIAQRESGNPTTTLGFNFGNPFYSISSGNSDDNGYGNFEYAPPSGYLALCTQNLATELSPTIDDASEYFNTVTYTGNASTNNITGVGFQPDWLWIKGRSSSTNHRLFDSTRGNTKYLASNFSDAEGTDTTALTSFDSDGFSLVSDGQVNGSGATYVAWNWLANGGTTSSNTDGSITSTVQANTTAGFSVVSYTGTGSVATIGHGLGKVPAMMIVKRRSGADDWTVYHKARGEELMFRLNTTSAEHGDLNFWNDTAPTSSVFTVGTNSEVNASGQTYIAYIFTEIEGYSKFGSYTGNGSSDGTFVHTGFKPAFVMIKRTDASGDNWVICDNKRDTFNVMENILLPNDNSAEFDETSFDFVSNGFKLRQSAGTYNASGGTIIYMAFAEHPFVTSSGVPVTAR